MQIYVMTRGALTQVKRWAEDLSTRVFLPYTKHGKPTQQALGVRPVQLWEIAFPDEQGNYEKVMDLIGKGESKLSKTKKTMLRKAVGAKPMRKHEFDVTKCFSAWQVAREFIGIREDARAEDGTELV